MNKVIEELQALIGKEVIFDGDALLIMDILQDGPQIVLQNLEHKTLIQEDQYGSAQRRVNETFTVHICDTETQEFHPIIQAVADDALLDLLQMHCSP